MSSKLYDEKKVVELWSALVTADGALRKATQALASSPSTATKQRWEVDYDGFCEARESYEEFMENIADSVEIPGSGK